MQALAASCEPVFAMTGKEALDYKLRADLDINDDEIAESLFVKIHKPQGRNVIVGVIYRPPDRNLSMFLVHYQELMQKISRENKICYIMGDFNVNLMNHQCILLLANSWMLRILICFIR